MIFKYIKVLTTYFVIIPIFLFAFGCNHKPDKTVDNNTQNNEKLIIKSQKKTPKHSQGHIPPMPPSPPIHSTNTISYKLRPKQKNSFTHHAELLAWLKKIENIDNRKNKIIALKELGNDIGAENLDNALKLARTISDSFMRVNIYKGIFEAQAEIDPIAALNAAEKLYASRKLTNADYEAALVITLRSVALTNPDIAFDHLDPVKSLSIKRNAMKAIYEGWGQLNQNDALSAAAMLSISEQNNVVPAIFKGWAQRDPFAAADYAEQLENSPIKRHILSNISEGFFISQWDEYNPTSTAESALAKMPKDIQIYLIPRIYAKWAETSPAAAIDHYINNHQGQLTIRDRTFNTLIKEWAKQDPAKALKWVDGILDNDNDYIAIVRTITGTIRDKNPEQAANILKELPFTFEDDTAGASEVFNLISSWVKKSPQDAIDWTASLENRQMKIIATKSIAASMTSKNYDEAFRWAESLQDPDMQAYAFSNISLNQAMNNFKKSDDWIERLPAGFVKVRTAAGYALGALQRARDTSAAKQFRQQLTNDELSQSELINILKYSKLDESTKNRMIELLE